MTNPSDVPKKATPPQVSKSDGLRDYRAQLVTLEQQSQTSFDRTLLTLSGGALGVSFAFVKDFLGGTPAVNTGCLVGAWGSWVGSLALVLTSHYVSVLATRKAIRQVDTDQIYTQPTGGKYSTAIDILNILGGASFIAGLFLVAVFVNANM